jgi:hypothetical protein
VSEATLPTLPASVAPPPPAPTSEWLVAARRARALSWLSLVWMGAEGAIAITAGILAGSIALIGFGIDSAIEGFASLVIVRRFTGHRLLSHAAEERAQKLVAVQFFLLAPYVAVEAVRHLVTTHEVEISVLGMVLTATSVIGMPFLGIAKQRLADTLGSSATHGERNPEPALRLRRRRGLPRPGRQRPVRLVVARSDRRSPGRWDRGQGGARDLARRGLLCCS